MILIPCSMAFVSGFFLAILTIDTRLWTVGYSASAIGGRVVWRKIYWLFGKRISK